MSAVEMDAAEAYRQIPRWARMELGIREQKADKSHLWFKVGMQHSTSWVEITLNGMDLYEVSMFKLRAGKRTELGHLADMYNDQLASELVALWCKICQEKGW
jgi:hypothetical protein